MSCYLSEINLPKCIQINYIILECNEKFSDVQQNNESFLEKNTRIINFIRIEGNIDLKFLSSSKFITVFQILNNQKYLLSSESITYENLYFLVIKNCTFHGETSLFKKKLHLQYLDISVNPIKSLKFLRNIYTENLKHFDVSSTEIDAVYQSEFKMLPNLEKLFIMNCQLKNIDKNSFENMKKLKSLIMMETRVQNEIEIINVKNLKKISKVKSDYFKICCFFWLYTKIEGEFECSPVSSGFESCSNLINTELKGILFWIFGIIGCLTNSVLMIFLIFQFKSKNVFQIQISLSDFFISLYLLIIAVVNTFYNKNYMEKDIYWRRSILCQTVGTITTFAMVSLVFGTFLTTIERFYKIVYPFQQNRFIKHKNLSIYISFSISLFISCIPFSVTRVSLLVSLQFFIINFLFSRLPMKKLHIVLIFQ